MKTIIAMIISLGVLGTDAVASDVGNGGGVICVSATKCVTLAEAGLKPEGNKDSFYQLPAPLWAEVKNIIGISGISEYAKGQLRKRVLGSARTYLPVVAINSGRLKALKRDYTKTLKQIDPNFNARNFEIVAWSEPNEKGRTFLLPRFYDLNLRQQAFVLIHEGNVRSSNRSVLAAALKFDALFYSLVQTPGLFESPNFDLFTYTQVIRDLRLSSYETLKGALLKIVQDKRIPLRLNEICAPASEYLRRTTWDVRYNDYDCSVSYEKLLDLANVDQRIVLHFENESISYEGNSARYLITPFGLESPRYEKFINDGGKTFNKYKEICANTKIPGSDADDFEFETSYLVRNMELPDWNQLSDTWLLKCSLAKPTDTTLVPSVLVNFR